MYELGDKVTVVSENIRIPVGTHCVVENLIADEYYIRNRDSQYCCWCKETDISLDMPDLDKPLTAENMNLDGMLNLATALIKSTKHDYISLAKMRYQTTGNWQHYKERNATIEFVRKDPYNIFSITGMHLTADDIFDAWDKEMLKSIAKNDWVEVITSNTGLKKNSAGYVIEVKVDDNAKRMFHVQTPAGNRVWCSADDLELMPRPRKVDMPKSKEKKNETVAQGSDSISTSAAVSSSMA